MRTVVTCVVAAFLSLPGAVAAKHASRPKPHPPRQHVVKPRVQPAKTRRVRAQGRVTLAERADELQLSESLMRKLQANLIEGGYLRGTIDGRLSERTRRALAEFQREYHLPGTGALDRPTAEALLGHDVITTFLVAHK